MPSTLLPELDRLEAEAVIGALSRGHDGITLEDAREVVARTLAATEHLRYTWEHPGRSLGERGLEVRALCEVCRSVLGALDTHLTLLELVRRLAEEVAAREKADVPRAAELLPAVQRVREERRKVESLLAFATAPRQPIDQERLQRGLGAGPADSENVEDVLRRLRAGGDL